MIEAVESDDFQNLLLCERVSVNFKFLDLEDQRVH